MNPVLRALGWDTENLNEVDPEFEDSGGGKVDYCLRHRGRDLVLIEVKRASADLTQHQGQLLRYAFGIGVELAALTNGLDWWLYLPMKGGRSFEGRRFARIDFRSQDAPAASGALTRFLDRDTTVRGGTLEEAEREFERRESDELVRAALPNAWATALADQRLRDLLAHHVRESVGVHPNADTIVEFLQSKGAAPAPPPSPTDGISLEQENAPEPPSQPPTAGGGATFKGQRFSAFWLDGARHEASNWRGMLQAVCEQLANEAGGAFGERVAHLRGRTRVYFSNSPDDLYRPLEIGNSGFYAEGNLSADDCVRLARRTLEAVRGSDLGFQIEAEARAETGAQKTRPTPPTPRRSTSLQRSASSVPAEPASFAGRRIAAFWLDNSRYEVASWPLMVRRLSEHLIAEAGPMFAARVETVRGRTRRYFSHEPEDLTHPRALANSNLHVEGNLGPDSAVRVAKLTLKAVRGSDDGFRIELAE